MAERQLCPTDLQINGAGLVPALTLTQRLRRPAAGYRMEEEEGDRRGQGRHDPAAVHDRPGRHQLRERMPLPPRPHPDTPGLQEFKTGHIESSVCFNWWMLQQRMGSRR